MSLALTGLVVFQIYWIDNVLRANKDRFQSDVHDALNNVASKIEKQEALHVAYDNLDTRFKLRTARSVKEDTIELLESTFKKRLISIQSIGEDSIKDMILLDFTYDFETSDIRETYNLQDNHVYLIRVVTKLLGPPGVLSIFRGQARLIETIQKRRNRRRRLS